VELITKADDGRFLDICSTGYASPDDVKLLTRSLYAALAQLAEKEAELKGYEAEKFRRMYYQGIVYSVCNWIDSIDGKKGTGIVCGTYETPTEEVEEALERIGKKLKELRLIKGVNDFTEAEEKELDELRTRVASLGSQLCRTVEALLGVEKWVNASIRLEQPSFDMPPEPATQRDHEAAMICAMIQDELALASSTPCAHAKEAERLREELGLARTYGCPCCSDLREAGEGALASINERIRQKRAEGWTADHDAKHEDQELAVVAACYAANGTYAPAIDWPETWASEWDKRKKHNREKQLAIAAALCMAEIDRLAELRRRMVYHK